MADQKTLTRKPKGAWVYTFVDDLQRGSIDSTIIVLWCGADEPFRQQKMKSWHLLLTPIRAIIIFFVVGTWPAFMWRDIPSSHLFSRFGVCTVGIAFVPTGTYLISQSDAVYQSSVIYDGDGSHVNCSIDEPNEGKQCQVRAHFCLIKCITLLWFVVIVGSDSLR